SCTSGAVGSQMISRSFAVSFTAVAITGCARSPSPSADVRSRPAAASAVLATSAVPPTASAAPMASSSTSPPEPGPAAPGSVPRRLCAGGGHTCFVDRGHTLWCWGGNYYGVIGIGTHGFGGRMEQEDVEHSVVKLPTRVASLAGKVKSVECGSLSTCATTLD